MSNVATGVIPSLTEHPVRRYWDMGLLITINTDDPGMFHNRLADEYFHLGRTFDFTPDEIRTLVLNAIRSAWRPNTITEPLLDTFLNHPNWTLPKLL